MAHKRNDSYNKKLEEDFTKFIFARTSTENDDEYKQIEKVILDSLEKYLKQSKIENKDIDSIFNIFDELLLFAEHRAYKIGFKDAVHLMK